MTQKTFLALTAIVAIATSGLSAADGIIQPTSVHGLIDAQPMAYDYQDDIQAPPAPVEGDIETSPSDVPVPATVPMVQATCGCDAGCNTGCGSCCPAPWRLFTPTCRGIEVYGHMDIGATANASDPLSRYNGPVVFNDRNELQMNQLWLTAKRDADNGGCGWAVGGRMDFIYGTDARFPQALGLEQRSDGSGRWSTERFYQAALPQLYGEVAYNDLSMKFGHYFTILGYETVNATENFFYSHSYAIQYSEPYTHTGMQFDLKRGEQWNWTLGWNFGWNTFENVYDRVSLLGGVKWNSLDERTKIALGLSTGDEPVTGRYDRHNRTMYSFVVQQKLGCNWEYVLQHDYGLQDQGSIDGGGVSDGDSRWYGVNQYLFYDYNCCWKFGGRFEWFRDNDGQQVFSPAAGGVNGFEGSFYAIAVGANWRPSSTTNLVVRPEVRWDWYHGNNKYVNGLQPYNDGASDNQCLFALDVILTY